MSDFVISGLHHAYLFDIINLKNLGNGKIIEKIIANLFIFEILFVYISNSCIIRFLEIKKEKIIYV